MATSAAPPYFHEWRIDDPENRRLGQVPFADGALHSNLPVECALEEQDRIWPEHQGYKKPLDIMVSVGTGKQPGNFKLPRWMDFAGTGELASAYVKNVFDTDRVWDTFSKSRLYSRSRHFRLTVELEKNVDLDEWDKMPHLYERVNQVYLESKRTKEPLGLWNQIENVAYQLTASLLFFEPRECEMQPSGPDRRRETVTGHIWCRLQTDNPAVRTLIDRIDGFYHREERHSNATRMQLEWNWKQKLMHQQRNGEPLELRCGLDGGTDANALQYVFVSLKPPREAGESRLVPISGFPISYNKIRAGMKQRGVQ